MAVGATYPMEVLPADGSRIRINGEITYTDSTNQPVNQANPVTSGTLPQFTAWSSGTAQQNPVTYPITAALAISGDGTNNAATVAVAISPNNSDYTTLATVTIPAGINTLGAATVLSCVPLPDGWWIKLTINAHASVAQSYYY